MSEEQSIRILATKIINDFKISVKDKIDSVLLLSATAESNLGTDSTKAEKNKVKADNKYIYKLINSIDPQTGSLLLKGMDA